MPTPTEVAYWFDRASSGKGRKNRKEVVDLVMSGARLDTISKLNPNYRAWVHVIQSVSTGELQSSASTYLRRMERGLSDILSMGADLPTDILFNSASVLRQTQELTGNGHSRISFVYAFRTPAREGIRVGMTDRGEARLRNHYKTYGELIPVGLWWPPNSQGPRGLEAGILSDLSFFRDELNQDWHLVDNQTVQAVALNRGGTFVTHPGEIWKRACR